MRDILTPLEQGERDDDEKEIREGGEGEERSI